MKSNIQKSADNCQTIQLTSLTVAFIAVASSFAGAGDGVELSVNENYPADTIAIATGAPDLTTIDGPDSVEAGSGIFWLEVSGQDDHANVAWFPITPRGIQAKWMFNQGLRLGIVAPTWCNPVISAPDQNTEYNSLESIEIQLIDFDRRQVDTKLITLTGDDDDDDDDPPPPEPTEKVFAWLIYDAEDERWGDVEVDFRDAANPYQGQIRIVKRGSANAIDQRYEQLADTSRGPVLILDSDRDSSRVLFIGPAPMAPNHPDGTREAIESLIRTYTKQPTPAPSTPEPEQQADSGRGHYVDVPGQEGQFVAPTDDPDDLIPVVERAGRRVFCVGDRCFEY